MGKRTASELIDLALIYAIQDREGMADAIGNAPERAEVLALIKEFRAYHKRRFGRKYLTRIERLATEAKTVSIHEISGRDVPAPPVQEGK